MLTVTFTDDEARLLRVWLRQMAAELRERARDEMQAQEAQVSDTASEMEEEAARLGGLVKKLRRPRKAKRT
jgi:hypothetical protein